MTTETKFFIPKAKDDVQAEEVWESVKKFAEETLDWDVSDRRIFSIAYQKRRQRLLCRSRETRPAVTKNLWLRYLSQSPILYVPPNRGRVTRYATLDSGIRIDSYYRLPTELENLI